MSNAYVEVVNASMKPFANTTDYDLGLYTTSSNQCILFGASNSGANAWVKMANSNVRMESSLTVNSNLFMPNSLYFYGEDNIVGVQSTNGGTGAGTATGSIDFRSGPLFYKLQLTSITNIGYTFNPSQLGRLTFPAPGLYQVMIGVPVTSTSGLVYGQIEHYNQASILQRTFRHVTSSVSIGLQLSIVVRILSANEYVDCGVYITSGASCRINFDKSLYAPYLISNLLFSL